MFPVEFPFLILLNFIQTLYHLVGGVFGSFWNVASTGTMTYTISDGSRNYETVALNASNDDFPFDSATLVLPLTCPFIFLHLNQASVHRRRRCYLLRRSSSLSMAL